MDDDVKGHDEAIGAEVRALQKLESINKSKEFNDYFDFLLEITSKKMFSAFVGNDIKSWEDFQRAKGEITAYLYPIQEVRSAKAMQTKLKEMLSTSYGPQ